MSLCKWGLVKDTSLSVVLSADVVRFGSSHVNMIVSLCRLEPWTASKVDLATNGAKCFLLRSFSYICTTTLVQINSNK